MGSVTVAAMAVAPSKPTPGNGRNASGKVVRVERGQQVSLELPNAALDLDRLFGQGGDHLRGEIRGAACCSIDLIGTKRMVGRVTASQIASASPASVLPRFT